MFETEPFPAESDRWTTDEIVVTPHPAAASRDYSDLVASLVREHVRRLDRGDSLANRVVRPTS